MRTDNVYNAKNTPVKKTNPSKQKSEKKRTPIDWETLFATTPTVDLRTEKIKEEDWVW